MREDVSFAGDAVPPDETPFAWGVLLLDGYYANIYGGYVPKPLRRWGHVVWDEHRWVVLGAKGLVTRLWNTVPELVEEIEDECGWLPPV